MAENKVCPHCGGKMFAASITRGCIVEVNSDDTYNILRESKDKYEVEIIKCARCHADITIKDLTVGVQCTKCGRTVNANDVDENGVCSVCNAYEAEPELANASKEDIVKMLLELRKNSAPMTASIEKQNEKAEEIAAKIQTSTQSTSDVDDDNGETETSVEGESTDTETEKPKRKRRRKATSADNADESIDADDTNKNDDSTDTEGTTTNEVAIETNETVEAVNDIANQQEAPFPDISLEDTVTVEPAPVMNPSVDNNDEFPMFEEESI